MSDWDVAEQQFARALRRRIFWRNFCDWLYKKLTGSDVQKLEKSRMHKLGI